MDITHIESMERNLVWITTRGFRVADLAVFLGFGELSDDWNA
jgi:hypothetical protein